MKIKHRCIFKVGSKGGLVSIFHDRMDEHNSHNGKFILLPEALTNQVKAGMIYECELLASRNDKCFVVTSAKLADDKLSLDVREDKVFVCLNGIASDKFSFIPEENSDYEAKLALMESNYRCFEIVCPRTRFINFMLEFETACKLLYKNILKAVKKENK